jgi:hypothetical protein
MKPIYLEKSLGIDIRDRSVCLALIGKRLRSSEVLASHFFEMEPLSEEKKSNEKIFLEEINQFLLDNETLPEIIVVGVPKNFVSFKTFHLPAPDQKSIQGIIEFELEKHCIANIDDLCYAYQAFPTPENKFRIHLSSVNKTIIEYYFNLIKRLNIPPSIIHLGSFSNLSLLKSQNEYSNSLAVLLDIGPSSTDIAILKDGNILNLTTTQLNNKKFSEGYFKSSLPFEACEHYARSILPAILSEIENGLSACSSLESGETVETIYIFRGSHYSNALSSLLEKETSVETALYSYPIENEDDSNYNGPPNIIDTAIALGLTGLNKTKNKLNFLPPELRPKKKSFNIKTTIGIGIAAILLMVAGIVGQIVQNDLALKSLSDQFKKVKGQAGDFEKIDLDFQGLDRYGKILQSIEKENPLKLPILNELTKIIPRDTWLIDTSLKNNELEIKGISASASKLIPILESSPQILDANFSGSIVKQKEGEKFSIKSTIKGKYD